MAELLAYKPGAEHGATIDWNLADGRVVVLVRVAYHKTAPDSRPGDWAICIAHVDDDGRRVSPFEWRSMGGDPLDINAAGFKSWQTVTHAPADIVADAERSPALAGAVRNWETR